MPDPTPALRVTAPPLHGVRGRVACLHLAAGCSWRRELAALRCPALRGAILLLDSGPLTFPACTAACPAETAAPPAALPAQPLAPAPVCGVEPDTTTGGAGWQIDQRSGGSSSSSEAAAANGGAQGSQAEQVLEASTVWLAPGLRQRQGGGGVT